MDIIDKYKEDLTVNGMSKHTQINYLSHVKRFLKHVKIEDITEETVKQYFISLQATITPSSINKHRGTLIHFFNFLKLNIHMPKFLQQKETIPEYVTEEFFEKEIVPVASTIFSKPYKILAILYFLFYTGIRKGEIDLIKREDIDLNKDIFKIYMPKSKREKYGIFTKKTKTMLEQYFKIEPEITNAFNTNGVAISQIFWKLRPYFKEIKSFSPHLFRHSYGTLCRQKGIAMEDLQDLMGHKSMNTTKIYAQSNPERLRQIYKETWEAKK
jgi:integrase/recombinase XerD